MGTAVRWLGVVAGIIVLVLIGHVPAAPWAMAAPHIDNLGLHVSPSQGPTGTMITVSSKDSCPPPPGASHPTARVTWYPPTSTDLLFGARTYNYPVAADGAWRGNLPASWGQPGPALSGRGLVLAACQPSPSAGSDYATYAEASFNVTTGGAGYFLTTTSGAVASYGDANICGTDLVSPASPVVGLAADPTSGTGVWLATRRGGVFARGDSPFEGSAAGLSPRSPVVAIAASPEGSGYWLVTAGGAVFSFGTARFHGSWAGRSLAAPVVGMAPTPRGAGYWLVAADGGVFSFGGAGFYGSMAGRSLNRPVVGIAITPDGRGYWLVAADGGVFSFGDAGFFGSLANSPHSAVVGLAPTISGQGYWIATSEAGVFTFGDSTFYGAGIHPCSQLGLPQSLPAVGLVATPLAR